MPINKHFKILLGIMLLFFTSGMLLFAANMPGEIDITSNLSYNIDIDFTAQNDSGSASVFIEAVDNKNCIRLDVTKKNIIINSITNGKASKIDSVNVDFPKENEVNVFIQRRGTELGIILNEGTAYRFSNVERGKGNKIAVTFSKWKQKAASVSPLDPVFFTDDFMRDYTDINNLSGWEIISGLWHLRSAWDNDPHLLATSKNILKKISGGQNPFSWVSMGAPAIAIVGEEEWEDYTFKAAFRAADNSAFGIITNYRDKNNYILAELSAASDKSENGNKIALYQIINGNKTLLNSAKGGYLPGEWYELSVQTSINSITVSVDGQERVSATGVPTRQGKAGLYINGISLVEIDNVSALGRDIDFDALREIIAHQNNDRFSKDLNGMNAWAGTAYDWSNPDTDNEIPYKSYRTNVYGDKLWILLTITPRANVSDGIINLLLNSVPNESYISYRAELNTKDGKTLCVLYQNDKAITKKTLDTEYLPSDRASTIRFLRENDIITLSIDDEIILSAKVDKTKITGFLPAFSASGRYPDKTPIQSSAPTIAQVLGDNLLDYTFDSAPTDWLTEGVWATSTRWSCDPEWSFLSGYSNSRVALWNKSIFSGDQHFQAYIGVKMEYERERNTYYDRYRNLNISICANGINPMSGYSGVYGSADKRMILYRNGSEVASTVLSDTAIPSGQHHNLWYDLEMSKVGNRITFTATIYMQKDERGITIPDPSVTTLTFNDADPIDSGVPVVWSYNNGISVARARMSFANLPKLRKGPFAVIDIPAYPEFISVGTPLVLNVKAVSTEDDLDTVLNIKNVLLPKDPTSGSENPKDVFDPLALSSKGTTLTFKPHFVGEYQYDITGIVGGVTTPEINLYAHVFDPTQNERINENLLLRYDFTEGEGNIIRDTSNNGEPVNLVIGKMTYQEKDADGKVITTESDALSAQLLEGQGLAMSTLSSVMSDKGIGTKFSALKETNTVTIEMWVSLTTIYSENLLGWLCSYFEINDPLTADGSKRWMTFGQNGGELYINSITSREFNPGISQRLGNVRTGLQHIIVTYDVETKLTTAYINGAQSYSKKLVNWRFDDLDDSMRLILGNAVQPMGNPAKPTLCAAFPGNIYYFAVYNKVFTEEEVKTNYNAGPAR